jgi:hypothetical protein
LGFSHCAPDCLQSKRAHVILNLLIEVGEVEEDESIHQTTALVSRALTASHSVKLDAGI